MNKERKRKVKGFSMWLSDFWMFVLLYYNSFNSFLGPTEMTRIPY
jgi:uncharacterized membrane protein